MIPPRPWSLEYAIARHYVDARRTLLEERERPRSRRYVEAAAHLEALRTIAGDVGLLSPTMLAVLGDEVFFGRSPDGRFEWLHETALELERVLNINRKDARA